MTTYIYASATGIAFSAVRRLQADIPGLRAGSAYAYLQQLIVEGHSRSTPKRWMRPGKFRPGSRFVYSHLEPDYCLVMCGGVVAELVIRGDAVPARVLTPGRTRERAARFDWRALNADELEAVA